MHAVPHYFADYSNKITEVTEERTADDIISSYVFIVARIIL